MILQKAERLSITLGHTLVTLLHHTILFKKCLLWQTRLVCACVCSSCIWCELWAFDSVCNLSVFYKEPKDYFLPNISVSFYFVEQRCHTISVSHITIATFLCSRTVNTVWRRKVSSVCHINRDRKKWGIQRARILKRWGLGVGLHTSIAGCLLFLVSFSFLS